MCCECTKLRFIAALRRPRNRPRRSGPVLTPRGPDARSNPALIRDDVSGSIWLIDGLTEAGYIADLWVLERAS